LPEYAPPAERVESEPENPRHRRRDLTGLRRRADRPACAVRHRM